MGYKKLFILVVLLFSLMFVFGGVFSIKDGYTVEQTGNVLSINETDFNAITLHTSNIGNQEICITGKRKEGIIFKSLELENVSSELIFNDFKINKDFNVNVTDYNIFYLDVPCLSFNNSECEIDKKELSLSQKNDLSRADIDLDLIDYLDCKDLNISGKTCVYEAKEEIGSHLEIESHFNNFSIGEEIIIEQGETKCFKIRFDAKSGGTFKYDHPFEIDSGSGFKKYIIDPFVVVPDLANGLDFNYSKLLIDTFWGNNFDGNISITGESGIENDWNSEKSFPSDYDPDLILYYKFDDRNATYTFDSTDYNNDGRLLGGARIDALGLWDTNAGFFDGGNNYIDISSVLNDFDKDKGTIISWINFESVSNEQFPAIFSDRTGSDIFEVWEDVGDIWFRYGNGATSLRYTYGDILNKNEQWAFVWDRTIGAKIYRNGIEVSNFTGTWGAVSLGSAFQIGQFTNYGSSNFKGKMDDFRIYNRVLTPNEILSDYNSWWSADYVSEIMDNDTNETVDWNAIKFEGDVNAEYSSINIQVRSCNDENCAGETFIGIDGTANTFFSTSGSFIELPSEIINNRYFQYKVFFDFNKGIDGNLGNYGLATESPYPYLSDVNIEYLTLLEKPTLDIVSIEDNLFSSDLPPFSYVNDKNLTIDVNVSDPDNNRLSLDLNASLTGVQGTGIPFVIDQNLTVVNCADENFLDSTECSFDLNSHSDLVSDGNYFIIGEISDGENNFFTSSLKNFMVDNTKPVTTSDVNNNVWQNMDANVNDFSCTDGTGSGCQTTAMRKDLDPGVGITYDSWIVVSDPNDLNALFEATTDANFALDINSTDNVENIEDTNTVTILIDKIKPQTIADFNVGFQPFDANITFQCIDSNSGCASTTIRIDSDPSSAINYGSPIVGNAEDLNAFFSNDGNYSVEFFSIDNANNTEDINTIYVLVDVTAPITTADFNTNWQQADANVTFTCDDGFGSGCQTTAIRKDIDPSSGTSFGAWIVEISALDLNSFYNSDGNWNTDYNSTDNINNIETTKTVSALIDTLKPEININIPLNGSTIDLKIISFDVNKIKDADINQSTISVGINGVTSTFFNPLTACTYSDGNYICTYTENNIVNLSNTIDINANDLAGNISDTNSSTFTFIPAPRLNFWFTNDINNALMRVSSFLEVEKDLNVLENVSIGNNLTCNGETFLGDKENGSYSHFDVNGTLNLFGNARVTKEVIFKAQGATKGASAPSDSLRDMGASGGLKYPVVEFSKVTQQDIFGEFHLPDDIDPDTNIEFHLMWIPGSGWTSGNYVWKLEYLVKNEDSNTMSGTPTTITMDVTPSNEVDIIETEFTSTIEGDSQQIIFAHFYRDVASDNGDDTGDVIFFEVEYTSNKLGES